MRNEMNTALVEVSRPQLVATLGNSLYPGASRESIEMVLSYCEAARLDPMQKPVHIVPMWDGKTKQMRDVVMPGVGLYRTQAARTNQFAGMSEPEFGPNTSEQLGGVTIEYPEWCRVTVKRQLASGAMAEFTAVEFWKENYAVKGGADKSIAPNTMWAKRPRGQIAKCAEAQALRKAFPEAIGAQPTAEEMEGKFIDESAIEGVSRVVDEPKVLAPMPDDRFNKNLPEWSALIQALKKTATQIIDMVSTKFTLTDEQKAAIRKIEADMNPEGGAA
jgi:phage recombination protein Bet